MDAGIVESSVLHPGLLYRAPDGDNGIRVPSWAHCLAAIGSWVGRLQPAEGRPLTVALALPCRPYAAAFTAVGVVVGRALDESHRISPDAHFRMLSGLPSGTPVLWRNGNRVLKGVLQGPTRHRNRDYLKVQVGSTAGGRETRLVGKEKTPSIRVAEHAGKLPKKQTGRRVKGVTPFLEAWLGEATASIVEHDRCDCVIVGRRSTLKGELIQRRFFINGSEGQSPGSLNEVIRARPFVTSTSNHRARIKTHAQGLPASVPGPEPPIVLFDGALAFLKTRPARARRHSVVLLDRSEPRFDDAVDVLMGVFHERGTAEDFTGDRVNPPPGLELLGFWED